MRIKLFLAAVRVWIQEIAIKTNRHNGACAFVPNVGVGIATLLGVHYVFIAAGNKEAICSMLIGYIKQTRCYED